MPKLFGWIAANVMAPRFYLGVMSALSKNAWKVAGK
jgi:hypothetical protein